MVQREGGKQEGTASEKGIYMYAQENTDHMQTSTLYNTLYFSQQHMEYWHTCFVLTTKVRLVPLVENSIKLHLNTMPN